MIHGDAVLAITLYCLFALVSAVGAFLIGNHFKSRRIGLISAAVTLSVFVGLFAVLTLWISRLLE